MLSRLERGRCESEGLVMWIFANKTMVRYVSR